MFVASPVNQTHRRSVAAGLAGAVLLLAGCATTPMAPSVSLNEARFAIQAAEKNDARQYAGAELDQARQKLKLADKAVVVEDMILAERFADESTVTAELASAKTEATKAVATNEEISRGVAAMIEEIQRAGDKQ